MPITKLQEKSLKHIWYPCSQMKDYEEFRPLVIKAAKGSYIELADGKKLLDAISSWWCKSLGHNHPRLKKAIIDQIEKFEHVILANTTHELIVNLSQELATLMPKLSKVFYAGDGSCAIEIAMKMSLHSRYINGDVKRNRFITLKDSYHGETIGALSVSDIGLYKAPYKTMLFQPYIIDMIPYVHSIYDPLWNDCSEKWDMLEKSLETYIDSTTALIVEPIVQGAGGMKIYSKDFLNRLAKWAKKHNIHLIADEIMTGIGRTGKMLACQHAEIIPDFICLAKGLTSGWMPFSAVLTTDDIYNKFYDDFSSGKAFLHSHTYSGNALGVAVALETLNIIKEERLHTRDINQIMLKNMCEIKDKTGRLKNVRGIGGIVAADLITNNKTPRLGYLIYQAAIKAGILLRPLGNTIYWLPPLNITDEEIEELKNKTMQVLLEIT
ncbi:MAG: adenosylmethionine--8-amino-7-oxononanoate transaminase [Rickettsiaceae bacterium]|nr:adenosylmethionine--8-amino-7-oxononanoate transaminase [Rickettsiaceae bacterium]